MARLEGTALVTGASSGIGREIARELAAKGVHLVIVSRSMDKLMSMQAELEKAHSVTVTPIAADLSKPGSARLLHAECARRSLPVTILVNNAGVGLSGQVQDLDAAAVESMLTLNIETPTTLASCFAHHFAARGRGAILNIGSVIGRIPAPFFASYAASKAYVLSFSVAQRAELKKAGVSVTCFEPGFVRTNFDESAQITSKKYKKFSQGMGMDARTVARMAVRAMARRRAIAAAGPVNRIITACIGFFPRTLLAWAVGTYMKGLLKDA